MNVLDYSKVEAYATNRELRSGSVLSHPSDEPATSTESLSRDPVGGSAGNENPINTGGGGSGSGGSTGTGGSGGTCFTADTPILMADGSYRNIENLKPEEHLHPWVSEKNKVGKVLVHQNNKYKILGIIISNMTQPLKVTPEHAIYKISLEKAGEWVNAGNLRKGDKLLSTNGIVEITDIIYATIVGKVYNLETSEHIYFANNILVHNIKESTGARDVVEHVA